jgi:hypothetical protein
VTTRYRAAAAAATAVALATGLLSSCHRGAGCGPIVHEPLAADFALHVLPGAPEPHYLTDPPTSGPHQPTEDLGGTMVDEPLSRPRQVGLLESGDVLIQYRPGDLDGTDLRPLLGPHVVVAPNPTLGSAVVATAWTYKRSCDAVDGQALRAFARARAGKPPGAP